MVPYRLLLQVEFISHGHREAEHKKGTQQKNQMKK